MARTSCGGCGGRSTPAGPDTSPLKKRQKMQNKTRHGKTSEDILMKYDKIHLQ